MHLFWAGCSLYLTSKQIMWDLWACSSCLFSAYPLCSNEINPSGSSQNYPSSLKYFPTTLTHMTVSPLNFSWTGRAHGLKGAVANKLHLTCSLQTPGSDCLEHSVKNGSWATSGCSGKEDRHSLDALVLHVEIAHR